MIQHDQAFDVQLALSRATRLHVRTLQLDHSEVKFVIGYVWGFTLDEHQLDRLHEALDSDAIFRERFDELKPDCLRHEPFRRQR